MAGPVTMIAVNRVRPEQADEFHRWLTDVAVPAAQHGDVPSDGWQVLRTGADRSTFLFLFSGGEPDDWDLERLLTAEYGADRAAAEIARMSDLLDGDQDVWTVEQIGV